MNEKRKHYLTDSKVQSAIDQTTMFSIIDVNGDLIYANDSFCKRLNYSEEDLFDKPFNRLLKSPSHFHIVEEHEKEAIWKEEIQIQTKDDTTCWFDAATVPYYDQFGNLEKMVTTYYDITARKHHEQYIEGIAYTDYLTKLPNQNQLYHWVDNQQININDVKAILYISLDRFKQINETFGKRIADKVITMVAERLQNFQTKENFLFRKDGDEFVVIVKEELDQEECMAKAENIVNKLRIPYKIQDRQISLTVSIGINFPYKSTYTNGHSKYDGIETSLKQARKAMILAKKNGGNRYCIHTNQQKKTLERGYLIDLELKEALAREEFSIMYQPIINLKSHKVVGAEALLRWNNREFGFISPSEFIPKLEESGMIVPVGKWILENVCRRMKSWQEKGLLMQRISVNVSPIQFKDKYFVQDVKGILNKTMLDASYLEIEITEGTILNLESSMMTILELKSLGMHVSIDDFGTGYSSLSYLKQLPIDTLKIDKSFIDDLDRDGEIITNTIINMGKNLHFRIIAEGIESEKQLEYLKSQQCHEGQGYFFSKPVQPNEIMTMLLQQSS
ncbi:MULTISPECIES: EAL domain-containing protein [unclassified Oceanobacillus]|uniref:EAL domain-containing protein n=1 Tax=unclassified Oceanobacillus TaxID=2630292 RepID=UPI001BE64FD1|nr:MULTISPECIES: EAL domain-containing protein [unclassified Oceanobacillus]MBT2598904.1 EAL domain-containing protein [Oceanobacillus sp. ISL-74]MBT2651823.1 EAL domain-containing protein [Oceanobacillus sp. ISL-73]